MLPRVHARKNTLNQDGDADTAEMQNRSGKETAGKGCVVAILK